MQGDQERFKFFQQNFVIKCTIVEIVDLFIVLNNEGDWISAFGRFFERILFHI